MKTFLTLAVVGVIGSTATLLAIPDVVGSFILGTNQRVEDFALSLDTWSEETFSSEWEDKSVEDTEDEIYQLKSAYVVFGVKAHEVRAIKRNGNLERFLVTFKPDNSNRTAVDRIVKTLHRNIEAYTGEDLVESKGPGTAHVCGYKEFEIQLGKNKNAGEVLVAIRRAPSTT